MGYPHCQLVQQGSNHSGQQHQTNPTGNVRMLSDLCGTRRNENKKTKNHNACRPVFVFDGSTCRHTPVCSNNHTWMLRYRHFAKLPRSLRPLLRQRCPTLSRPLSPLPSGAAGCVMGDRSHQAAQMPPFVLHWVPVWAFGRLFPLRSHRVRQPKPAGASWVRLQVKAEARKLFGAGPEAEQPVLHGYGGCSRGDCGGGGGFICNQSPLVSTLARLLAGSWPAEMARAPRSLPVLFAMPSASPRRFWMSFVCPDALLF